MDNRRMVIAAIGDYYTQLGLSEHYMFMAQDPTIGDEDELMDLSEKHFNLARKTYDYIITNFKMDIEQASSSIKEHLEKESEVAH